MKIVYSVRTYFCIILSIIGVVGLFLGVGSIIPELYALVLVVFGIIGFLLIETEDDPTKFDTYF